MTPGQIIEQIWELHWYQVFKVAIYDDFILLCKIWPLVLFLVAGLGGYFWYLYREGEGEMFKMKWVYRIGTEIVTKEEFYNFIENYPNELVRHVVTICDPPLYSYNDFTAGKKYPESIVASFREDIVDEE